MAQVMREIGRFISKLCLVFILMLHSVSAQADEDVLIVTSKDTRPYQSFYDGVTSHLAESGSSADLVTMVSLPDLDLEQFSDQPVNKYKLVIAVGSRASSALTKLDTNVPILCVMVPKSIFKSLQSSFTGRNVISVIYIDQPESRILDLINVALPDVKNVGMLVSDVAQLRSKSLVSQADNKSLKLETGHVDTTENIVSVLNSVLDKSDVLLTLPDPVVLNNKTVQSVLLTAYIHKTPVVSYSPAYVRAGALLAVYSSPTELGRQIAEELVDMNKSGNWSLSKPEFPRYFSVSVNDRVARSLGISLADADVVKERLIKLSGDRL